MKLRHFHEAEAAVHVFLTGLCGPRKCGRTVCMPASDHVTWLPPSNSRAEFWLQPQSVLFSAFQVTVSTLV